ncbi:Reverse transcriptase (RNA-dependent DNA polymerase) [Flagellimonas zhangzhouensis]|nr:Reverse transcriptase (RNA-dependent DNA polymerase) [Allomuricauda zhangzhouensis]
MSKVLHQPSGKDIYPLAKEPASFFAMKQLQFNIHRTFGVKQANRYLISKQVQNLLKDNFPKIILRTDVANFYESVPQFRLLRIINNNQLLTPKSKRLIKSLLFSYNNLSNQQGIPERDQVGIPRGIGISAYLAELYMRDIDEKINRLDGITYYARYVDDIIVLFTPSWKLTEPDYISKVENVIQQSGLNINNAKTYCHDIQKDQSEINIEFLGYIFKLKTSEYQGTSMSKRKIDKYLERINKSIDKYFEQLEFAPKKASKLLIHRFNYLTKNTRLHKPKKGLVGIYYSNSLIEQDCGDLLFLDEELHKIVDAKLPVSQFPKLNQKLKKYSFNDGFVNRSFFNINSKKKNISDLRPIRLKENKKLTNNFERVISIWK